MISLLKGRAGCSWGTAATSAAFSYFPLSAGVANVRAHLAQLPRAPAFVATADRGRGFAEIAATILAARGRV